MNIAMRLITLIFLLVVPSFGAAELRWPDTKYDVGTCITPTNTKYFWYGKTGYILDLVYSKKQQRFLYNIFIEGLGGQADMLLFPLAILDNNTAEVTPCPN